MALVKPEGITEMCNFMAESMKGPWMPLYVLFCKESQLLLLKNLSHYPR